LSWDSPQIRALQEFYRELASLELSLHGRAAAAEVYDVASDRSVGRLSVAHVAVIYGQTSTLDALLEAGLDAIHPDELGWTALHWAVLLNNIESCKLLCSAGVNTNLQSEKFSITPLHIAALLGRADLARILCEYGAEVRMPVEHLCLDSIQLAIRGSKDEETATILLQTRSQFHQEVETPTSIWVNHQILEDFMATLPNGVDLRFAFDTAMTGAASDLASLILRRMPSLETGHVPVLHQLLNELKDVSMYAQGVDADNDGVDDDTQERIPFLEGLIIEAIDLGASVNSVHLQMKPLDIALLTASPEIIQSLLARNAQAHPEALVRVLSEMVRLQGLGLLSGEKSRFMNSVCGDLVQRGGCDAGLFVGSMAPIDLVFLLGDTDLFELMVQSGARLGESGRDGLTIPQRISAEFHTEGVSESRVEFLITVALVVHAAYPDMLQDVLDHLADSPYLDNEVGSKLVIDLLEAKAQPDSRRKSDGNTPLHCAARGGCLEIVDLLLHCVSKVGTAVLSRNNYGVSPLGSATWGHKGKDPTAVMRALLDAGGDANLAGGQYLPNMTPLHQTTVKGLVDATELLLAADADPNAEAYWRRTPLHFCSHSPGGNTIQLMELLLESKGDINKQDLDGETPLSIVLSKGEYAIVHMLLERPEIDIRLTNSHNESAFSSVVVDKKMSLWDKAISETHVKTQLIELRGELLPVALASGFEAAINFYKMQETGLIERDGILGGINTLASCPGGKMSGPLWLAAYHGRVGVCLEYLENLDDIDDDKLTQAYEELKEAKKSGNKARIAEAQAIYDKFEEYDEVSSKASKEPMAADYVMKSLQNDSTSIFHGLIQWGGESHIMVLRELLATGMMTFEDRDTDGYTPLMRALSLGNDRAADLLVNEGAELYADDLSILLEQGAPSLRFAVNHMSSCLPAPSQEFKAALASAGPPPTGSVEDAKTWSSLTGLQWGDVDFKACLGSLVSKAGQLRGTHYHSTTWHRARNVSSGACR